MLFNSPRKTSCTFIHLNFISLLLLSLSVFTFTGCSSDSEKQNPIAITNTSLKITVVDEKGLPVEAVDVSSPAFDIVSTQYNALKQLVLDIAAKPSPGVIKLSKSGYLDSILFLDSVDSDALRNVTLLTRAPAISIDSSQGGKFSSKDGASVDIPSLALVNSNGDLVFGAVDLFITPLDISDDIQVNAFPGSFKGMPTGQTQTELLYSYAVVEYSFYQNGEELQLLSGTEAELELPLYASQHFFNAAIKVGDTIPLWTLDEITGVWIQQSMGTVVANAYSPTGLALRASTTHFSKFNADRFNGLAGGSPPDDESQCTLTVLFQGLIDNNGYELILSLNGSSLPASRDSYSFVYKDPQSMVTGIPRNTPMHAKVVGPVQDSQGRIVTGESGSVPFSCGQSDEEVIITLSLRETVPEFTAWQPRAKPVFTKNNGIYEIISNQVFIGGYFTGTEQVEVSSEIIGFPLFLPNGQFYDAEYLEAPVHSNPTSITATLSNSIGTVERETQINFIDSAPPEVFYLTAYHRAATLDTMLEFAVDGADSMDVIYINPLGTRIDWFPTFNLDVDSRTQILVDLYPNEGQLEVTFHNQYADLVELIPLHQINPAETD